MPPPPSPPLQLNVLLDAQDTVKIVDLGVAKQLSHVNEMASTIVGTPYYLSPELCEDVPYSSKSDVWALGCILYELCTLQFLVHAVKHAGFGPTAYASVNVCQLPKCLGGPRYLQPRWAT